MLQDPAALDGHGARLLPAVVLDSYNIELRVREAVPEIAGQKTTVLMHNDAVVQGLSEIPFTRDLKHWGC